MSFLRHELIPFSYVSVTPVSLIAQRVLYSSIIEPSGYT